MEVITPYRGLIPFQEDDAGFFFGRDRDVRRIVNHLFASPLVVLYGANGVGKSSVLRAGVVRVMSEREELIVAKFNSWAYENPVAGLNATIREAIERATGTRFDDATAGLADLLSESAEQTQRRFIIILDQFEEFFLYHNSDESGAAFASEFASVVWRRDLPVSFLVSVREDSLAQLDYFQERIPQLLDSRLRLDYMDRAGAEEAIRKPLHVYNQRFAGSGPFVSIEDALVTVVLDQVCRGSMTVDDSPARSGPSFRADDQIETPFLQMVMTRLWEAEVARGSNVLRLQTLQELGGAVRIAGSHMDSALAQLYPKERDDVASIVRFLITPSGTKIAQDVESLAAWAEIPVPRVRQVLDKLSTSRILRTISPPQGESEPRYEIFHDVLAPSLLDWRRRYETEKAMKEARNEVERLSAKRVRRFASVAIVSALILMVMLGLTWYAMNQRAVADTQRAEAEKQKAEADAQRKIAEEYADKLRMQAQQSERKAEDERVHREFAESIAQGQRTSAELRKSRARIMALTSKKKINRP